MHLTPPTARPSPESFPRPPPQTTSAPFDWTTALAVLSRKRAPKDRLYAVRLLLDEVEADVAAAVPLPSLLALLKACPTDKAAAEVIDRVFVKNGWDGASRGSGPAVSVLLQVDLRSPPSHAHTLPLGVSLCVCLCHCHNRR